MLGNNSTRQHVNWDRMLREYPFYVRGMGKLRADGLMCLWRGIEASFLSQVTLTSPHLDCGCGDGIFSLVTFGPEIGVGVDIDLPAILRARTHRAYQDLLCADLSSLPFRDSAFGSIVSNSVIEHVADDSAVLREIRRVSIEGSHLYLTSVSENLEQYTLLEQALSRLRLPPFNEIRVLYARWMREVRFIHRRFYTPASLTELAGSCGYRTTLSVSFGGPLFTAVWSILALIVIPLPWPLLNLLRVAVHSQIMSPKGAILALVGNAARNR